MSLRLQMLQVARLAPRLLGDSADLIVNFLERQRTPEGAFGDRSGQADLYYTVFGIDALLALQRQPDADRLLPWLAGFGTGEGLDFVHLCSLIRCRAFAGFDSGQAEAFGSRLRPFRAQNGGYHPQPGSPAGTAYGNFLAWGAWQDLQNDVPEAEALTKAFQDLKTKDGAWANETRIPASSTTATAAAITVLGNRQLPVPESAGDWLLARRHDLGGFLAAPGAPAPDLLSTATALHALACLDVSFQTFRESCLDYLDSLWTNEGSFHGHWQEETLDCEYTFYGLLALGHLSVG